MCEVVVLSATDPANPLRVDSSNSPRRRQAGLPRESSARRSILTDGAIAAWLARGDRQLVTFLPEGEPDRSKARARHRARRSSTARAQAATRPVAC